MAGSIGADNLRNEEVNDQNAALEGNAPIIDSQALMYNDPERAMRHMRREHEAALKEIDAANQRNTELNRINEQYRAIAAENLRLRTEMEHQQQQQQLLIDNNAYYQDQQGYEQQFEQNPIPVYNAAPQQQQQQHPQGNAVRRAPPARNIQQAAPVRQAPIRQQAPQYQHQQQRQEQYIPTMRELNSPVLTDQSWCISLTPEMEELEVNSQTVHHLPKFEGNAGDEAGGHLMEFNSICQAMKPRNASDEWFKLRYFPFSLQKAAKQWFLSLPAESVQSWEQMKKRFVDKYCPPSKANQLRKELSTIKQGATETMYEYVERFSALERSCSLFGVPEKMLVDYLLDGLRSTERMMLEASAGGSVLNLTPGGVRNLVIEVAESARYREENQRRDDVGRTRTVAQVEVENAEMSREVRELRETMQKMLNGEAVQVKVCEFCRSAEHKTESCPTLIPPQTDVNAVGFQNSNRGQQGKFGLANSGFSWRNDGMNQQQNHNQNNFQPSYRQFVPFQNKNQQLQNHGPSFLSYLHSPPPL